jgi:ribulose-5-phosphate 4-epimerase/fuculose-1-phosphate aldolase
MAEAAAFSSGLAQQVERAHRRLTEKELLRASDDAVSVLLPGRGAMLFWAGSDAALQELPLSGLRGVPALHGEAYRLRPDAGALASLSTGSSPELSRGGGRIPIVFDEQARHIGEAFYCASAAGLRHALRGGGNAGVVEGRLFVLGVTPSRMIFNAELFEKCARAYLIARGSEQQRRIHRIPWWVRLVAGRRLRRDQAQAARCHALGREAPELMAY